MLRATYLKDEAVRTETESLEIHLVPESLVADTTVGDRGWFLAG